MAWTGHHTVRTGNLLGPLLLFAMIIGQAYQDNPKDKKGPKDTKNSCDCSILETYSYYPHGFSNGIVCQNINTTERVDCAGKYIAKNVAEIGRVELRDTDIDKLPEDFLPLTSVKKIDFLRCKMSRIPPRLIESSCPFLTDIWINECDITDKTIPAEVFGNCRKLQKVGIINSGIETVSKQAFETLVNLSHLFLDSNKLESFGGFDGVGNLTHLSLMSNSISYIDRNAFRGLNKLTNVDLKGNQLVTLEEGVFDPFMDNEGLEIFLSENPFHCNCLLKWLQDWLHKSEVQRFTDDTTEPECETPSSGALRILNFCNQTNLHMDPLTTLQKDSPAWPMYLVVVSCILVLAATSTVLVLWLKVTRLGTIYVRRANIVTV